MSVLWARSLIYSFLPHSPATVSHTGLVRTGLLRHWEGEVLRQRQHGWAGALVLEGALGAGRLGTGWAEELC